MIASCYRRMNLFNEALKVYEEIYEQHPDNIDCLRGLVQIRKELGMKYQQYAEKLMVLDREEEARRQYEYQQNPQAYQAAQAQQQQQPAMYGMGGNGEDREQQQAAPDMPNMVDVGRPANKRIAAAKQAANDDEEGGWGDTAALLD